jgi:hypothetical protein
MKIKRFQQLNEEIHPNDEQQLHMFVNYLNKIYNKKIDVNVNDFNGEIYIDNSLVFTTSGSASISVISAYISGMVKASFLKNN